MTTHHERDIETGLDYRGARFYDADIGRFLSLDPAAAEYPSWSDYNYVLGNPISLIDPTGRNAVVSIERNKDKDGKETGGGEITISARVFISGNSADQDMVDAIQKDFNSVFKDGVYTDKDGNEWSIKIDVKFEFFESSEIDFFTNLMKADNNSWGRRDNVLFVQEGLKASSIKRGSFIEGEGTLVGGIGHIQSKATADIYTHETGHLLGLSDRYDHAYPEGKRVSIIHPGFENDIMGSGRSVHQTHYNNWGKYSLEKGSGKRSFHLQYVVDQDGNTMNLLNN